MKNVISSNLYQKYLILCSKNSTKRASQYKFHSFFHHGNILGSRSPHSIFTLQPIGEDFVSRSISLLKTNKAIVRYIINARVLKDAVDVIAPSVTALLTYPFKRELFLLYGKQQRLYLCLKRVINRTLLFTGQFLFCRL